MQKNWLWVQNLQNDELNLIAICKNFSHVWAYHTAHLYNTTKIFQIIFLIILQTIITAQMSTGGDGSLYKLLSLTQTLTLLDSWS